MGATIAGTGDAQQQTELVSRCVKLGLPWSAAGKPAPSSVLFVVATAAAAVQAAASLPSADAAGRCLTHAASAAAAMGRAVALADAFWAALLDKAAAEREGRSIALSVLPELERAARTMPAAICLLHRAAPALVRHAKDAGAEITHGGGSGGGLMSGCKVEVQRLLLTISRYTIKLNCIECVSMWHTMLAQALGPNNCVWQLPAASSAAWAVSLGSPQRLAAARSLTWMQQLGRP